MTTKKCYIFDNCVELFPELEMGQKMSDDGKIELVATSKDDSDLKLIIIDNAPLKGQFRVKLFNEFELNDKIRQHPCFTIKLDFATKRAEVLSFESNLFPYIKLDAYVVVDDKKYTNIVAVKDLKNLCLTWIKQLKELNYRPEWKINTKTA